MNLNDPQHLLANQYRTPANLNARIELQRRYSTNTGNYHHWLLDHLLPYAPAEAHVLEVGGGNGELWRNSLDHVPQGWHLTITDVSPGMVEAARAALAPLGERATFMVVDAQSLPYADASFDAAIANHMLYHVADRPRALAELRRVLRPGGRLLAATNGVDHMRELDALIAPYIPTSARDAFTNFTMQNGAAQLAAVFSAVSLDIYDDALIVTEVEPLLAYIDSLLPLARVQLSDEGRAELGQRIAAEIAARGAFHITKEIGIFTALA